MRIGIGLGLERRRGTGGGGGGGPPPGIVTMPLGVNAQGSEDYLGFWPFPELLVGRSDGDWQWRTGSFGGDVGALPSANVTDGWPNSLPAPGAYVYKTFGAFVEATGQIHDITWTSGNIDDAHLDADITDLTWNNTTKTGSFTLPSTHTKTLGRMGFVTLYYTFTNGTAPKGIQIRRRGDPTSLTYPEVQSMLQNYTGIFRLTKMIGAAEQQGGHTIAAWGGGTYASPQYVYTAASRAVPTGGIWRNNFDYKIEGLPWEHLVDLANLATNCTGAYFPTPYQAADDWITGYATYVRDNFPTKNVYTACGNETSFTGIYDSYQQCTNEAFDATRLAGVTISSIAKGTPFSLSTTCTTSSGSNTVTNVANVTGLTIGLAAAITGYPAGTQIIQIFPGPSGTSKVVLSQPFSGTPGTGVAATFSGCTAIVTTTGAHNLTSTERGAITGATPTDFNTAFMSLTVNSSTTFTYTCSTTPAGNATVVGSYTHNGYPEFGIGGAPTILRYIHASQRVFQIWHDVFAAAPGGSQVSRLKLVYEFQHVDPTSTMAPIIIPYAQSAGYMTLGNTIATAPYYRHLLGAAYNDATAPGKQAVFDSFKANIDTQAAITAKWTVQAANMGYAYISYEAGCSGPFNDVAYGTSIMADSRMYDTDLYYYQKEQQAGRSELTIFNVCQNYTNTGGGFGWYGVVPAIFQEDIGGPLDRAHGMQRLAAVQDYLAGVRTPLPLSTTGLSVVVGSPVGTSVGTITGKDLNSTLSFAGLYGNDSGNFAIDGSGNVTLANSGAALGTHNITVRDTNPGYPAPGYVDTNFTAAVSAWMPNNSATPLAFWFTPSPATCFTDTIGTVPVVNDGDLVAYIRDNLNGSLFCRQFTSANRPVYRTGGGKPYLEYAGGTVRLDGANTWALADGSGQHSGGVACYFTSNSGTQKVVGYELGSPAFGSPLCNAAGTSQTKTSSTPANVTDNGPSISINTGVVLSELTSTASIEVFVNGVGNGSTSMGANTLPTGTTAAPDIGNALTGRVYGFAMYKGLISGTDHTKLVTYLQSLY